MGLDPALATPDTRRLTVPASVRRRLAATVYEALLLTAIAMLVGFATLPLVGPRAGNVALNGPIPLPTLPGRMISLLCLLAAWGAYCIGFWTAGRRTLPMKTWQLVLETPAGVPIGWRVAAIRYLACWIGPACAVAAYIIWRSHGAGAWACLLLGINYVWAAIDPERQFLHDRIAGSRLRRQLARKAS